MFETFTAATNWPRLRKPAAAVCRFVPAGSRDCNLAARFVLRCSFCWTGVSVVVGRRLVAVGVVVVAVFVVAVFVVAVFVVVVFVFLAVAFVFGAAFGVVFGGVAVVVFAACVFEPPVAAFGAWLPCEVMLLGACDDARGVAGFAPPPCCASAGAATDVIRIVSARTDRFLVPLLPHG